MSAMATPPIGAALAADIEYRPGSGISGYRARVRWSDPITKRRRSKSRTFANERDASQWIAQLQAAAAGGVDPDRFTQPLREYGEAVMDLALRGLESKTTDPYRAGWRKRVVPPTRADPACRPQRRHATGDRPSTRRSKLRRRWRRMDCLSRRAEQPGFPSGHARSFAHRPPARGSPGSGSRPQPRRRDSRREPSHPSGRAQDEDPGLPRVTDRQYDDAQICAPAGPRQQCHTKRAACYIALVTEPSVAIRLPSAHLSGVS
jgi:hypothetical protein